MKVFIKSSQEPKKDFDIFMLMDYHADVGPDTMGMAGDRFSCLGKFYASSLEEAKNELEQIKNKVKSENPDFYDAVYSGLYVTAYNEAFDDFEEDPYYGMPIVYPNLSDLLDAVIYPADYYGEDDELPFDLYEPTEEEIEKSRKDFLADIMNEFVETLKVDPDFEIKDASYDISDNSVSIKVIFNNGYEIVDWKEDISDIPLDSDRYAAINYLTNKLANMEE